MSMNNKRSRHASSPPSHEQTKRYHSSSALNPLLNEHQYRDQKHEQQISKRPTFVSYLEIPNLPPKIKLLCDIIANTPSLNIENILNDTGLRVSQEDVEQVLKLSYRFPAPAVKFFRWSGFQLKDNHSPYAWNLVVDLLGKNCLFDAMWDAIKSMKKERLLSLATFASVFSSYVAADRVQEAIMTFEIMDQYGIPRDILALNSLLSAICRDGQTSQAQDFLRIAKDKIRPDADTYAILLEGWENETNVANARQTFDEMVYKIGWDPANVPAYDSFLKTLIKGPDGICAAMKLLDVMKERKCYPSMKFFKSALEECKKMSDDRGASSLWEVMVDRNTLKPDTQMYNSMIGLYCHVNKLDSAKKLLDEMVFNGSFPNSQTYNILFQYLVRNRRLRELSAIFTEMVKNECFPSQANCSFAVRAFIDNGDHYMAIKVWKFMLENYEADMEETGNLLVNGLRDLNRIPEAVKYAEDMIDRKIKLNSSTLTKLKQLLIKMGKPFLYDELLKRWKNH